MMSGRPDVPSATVTARPTGRLLRLLLAPGALAALWGMLLCLLAYQTPARYTLEVAAADGRTIGGFYAPEQNAGGSFRWTAEEAGLLLPPLGTPAELRVVAVGARPATIEPPVLTVLFDGQEVAAWPTQRGEATLTTTIPRRLLSPSGAQLLLRSPTYVPGAQDRRRLGVAVRRVELVVPAAGRLVTPPLAVLALAAGVAVLLQRTGRHLGLGSRPSLAAAGVVTAALAGLVATDRARWTLAAPAPILAICGLALTAALAPPLLRRLMPPTRAGLSALRHGRLPTWPEAMSAGAVRVKAGPRAIAATLGALAALLTLLHLLSGLLPPEQEVWHSTAWGVRFVYRFPALVPILLSAPVLLLAAPAISRHAAVILEALLTGSTGRWRGLNPYALAALGGALLFPLLWLLRADAGRFGDSLEIQRKIAEEGAVWREREPLDFFLHVQAYRLLHPLTGWDVATVYAVLSCLAGSLFFIALLLMSGLLARGRGERALIVALAGTAGAVQLFFGYLESYTLMTAGLAVYLLLGLLCLSGRVGIGVPAAALGLAACLHPIALAAAPALAVPALWHWHRQGYRPLAGLRLALPLVAGLVVPFLLLIALFIANGYTLERWAIARNQFGGGDMRTFKPLVTLSSHREYYPLPSLDHVRAVANQWLLIAPLGWPLTATLLAAARPRGLWRDPRFAFLLLAAASTTAFTALWNPDLGAMNDWDLLSISALPSALLAAFLLVSLVQDRPTRHATGLALLAVNLFHTGLWVAGNSRLFAPWLTP